VISKLDVFDRHKKMNAADRIAGFLTFDQSNRSMTELTLSEAQALYERHQGRDDGEAVRAIYAITKQAERNQIAWGRLHCLSMRDLGLYLISNGRSRGRPRKLCDPHNYRPSLAELGIADRHIATTAKLVGYITQKDFDSYMAGTEAENILPTVAGLFRSAEQKRIGMPHRIGRWTGKSPFDVDPATSSIEHFTPPDLITDLGGPFDLDVCSPGPDHWTAKRHLTRRENGLVASWGSARDVCVFMNPPYGIRNGVEEWIERFVEHGNGVCLVSNFTAYGWWQQLAAKADAILAVHHALKFLPRREGKVGQNDMGSTLIAYGERGVERLQNAERAGRGRVFYGDNFLSAESARLRAEVERLRAENADLHARLGNDKLLVGLAAHC
jgi:hypothetical protein